jgi:hypothetical protein
LERVELSRLVDFYRGEAPDSEGRLLSEIWDWADHELEAVHDFIQWLFPLPERSGFNPRAPLLNAEDIATFQAEPLLRANLHRSFSRMLEFLGLVLTPDGEVKEGRNFAARVGDVWASANHNWLRITRILRSLTLLGLAEDARCLFCWLEEMYRSRRFPIPADTFQYWTWAAGSES